METLAVRLRWLARMQPPGSNEQRLMLEAAEELEYEQVLDDLEPGAMVVEFTPELTYEDVLAFMREREVKLLPWQVKRLSE